MSRFFKTYIKFGSFFLWLKPHLGQRLIVSAILAALIIIADYFIGNLSYPIFDSSSDLGLQAYLHDFKDNEDDFFAVNTAFDKSLAVAIDEYGDSCGYIPVTDRQLLTKFLNVADKSDYKYIFLDIRFDRQFSTPFDSVLFRKISNMPRIAFSRHRGDKDELEDSEVISKGAFSDFRTTRTNGFSRYEFLQDGQKSVALKMYEDIDCKSIFPTWWGGYRDNDGWICRNMQFVPFPKKILSEYDPDDMDAIRYPLMGSQHLGKHTEEELIRMMNGKVILIGDFNNDMHDTYIGEVPGPLLSYYAWRVLQRGNHRVNLWLQLFLFIFYTVSINLILRQPDKAIKANPLVVMALSLLGWSAALWVLKSIIYWIFGLSFLVIIPSIIFSAITTLKEFHLYYIQK